MLARTVPVTRSLEEAAAALARGELVAFPTETVYGLGARADREDAVQAIFRRKGRPADRPLLVHLSDAADVSHFADRVPDTARRLAEAFWPGPLSLVLPVRPGAVAPSVLAGGDTVGLRLPDEPTARALAARLAALAGRPVGIAAPSANPFGAPPPATPEAVLAGLGSAGYTLLDAGPCPGGVPSTVVACLGDRAVVVHREGAVPCERLAAVLGAAVTMTRAAGRVSRPPRAGGR